MLKTHPFYSWAHTGRQAVAYISKIEKRTASSDSTLDRKQ